MKKALAIISALALVSAVAFAEDGVKISGQIETGIQAQTGDGKDYVKLWETDAPGATRIDLNVDATQGNTGLWFKLRSADGATAPSVANFKVFANLFDNKATIVAGNPDDNSWKTDADKDFTYENGYGVRLEVKPVAGLNFGVKLNTVDPTKVAAGKADYDGKQAMNELAFGGKYTAEKFFIAGGYKLDSNADDDTATMYGYDTSKATALATVQAMYVDAKETTAPAPKAEDEAAAYVGFGYTGIENLLVQAEAKFENLGAYGDIGLATADEVVEYKIDDKTKAGVVLTQYLPGNSVFANQLAFKPYANYKLNDITLVKAELGYTMNSAYLDGYNDFYVQPGAEFQLTANSQIRADYAYNIKNLGGEDKFGGEKTTYSTVNLGFRYNF